MALKTDYGSVRTMVAIENPMVRRGTIGLLGQFGFKNIVEISNFVKIHQIVNEGEIDLIITNASMGDFFVGQIVREMRTELKSISTFAIVVLLSQQAEQEFLRKVIDCGPDDVLLMPFSPQQLLDRVKTFTERRKPFIVTFNYIGPDRRKQGRNDGGEVIPLVEVPNLLQARAQQASPSALANDSTQAIQRLTRLRIQRDGVQFRWLCDAVRKLVTANRHEDPVIADHLNGMLAAGQDLKLRTQDWTNSRLPGLLAENEAAIGAALASYGRVDFKHAERALELGGKISGEITRALA